MGNGYITNCRVVNDKRRRAPRVTRDNVLSAQHELYPCVTKASSGGETLRKNGLINTAVSRKQ